MPVVEVGVRVVVVVRMTEQQAHFHSAAAAQPGAVLKGRRDGALRLMRPC